MNSKFDFLENVPNLERVTFQKIFFEKKYSRTEGQFIQHTQGIDFYMSHSILH